MTRGTSMCGIVGLFLKDAALQPELGTLTGTMLGALCDRGPDSAGFAVYGAAIPGHLKLTLRARNGFDWDRVLRPLADITGAPERATILDTHAVIVVSAEKEPAIGSEIERIEGVDVVGSGRRMEIF